MTETIETTLTINDFTKMCRLCLKNKTKTFTILSEDIDRLYYCTGLKVESNDGLPDSVCTECHKLLNKFYNFKHTCVSSYQILLNIFRNKNQDVKLKTKGENSVKDNDDILNKKIKKEVKSTSNDDFDLNDLTAEFKEKQDNLEQQNINISQLKNEQKDVRIKCKVCDKITKLRTYEHHLRRHEKPVKYKCDLCPKAYRQPCELATHKSRAHKTQNTITCEVCKKVFQLQAQLDFHLRSHYKKKYVCDVCHKVFLKSTMLTRHKEIHDKERKKYCCTQCDASFLQEISLKRHIANRHTDKPIEKKICNICGLAVVNLRPHTLLKHTTGPQFKCEQCDRAFLYRSQWVSHVKEKHEGVPKQKKALCITCGKCFPSQGYLRKHLSTHSEDRNFKCHLCPKRYKKSDHLKVHLRVHAGYRPHACNYCSKAFHTSTILKNHIRTHTGEKPFSCCICSRAFAHKGALITHMKVHNGM